MSSVSGWSIRRLWCLAALALGIGAVAPLHATSKTVNMKLIVLVNAAPPCTITGGTVAFGNVLTTLVDGVNYVQPVSYTLNCSGRVSDYLKLQIQGTSLTVNGESVLKTSATGLGIRIRQAGNKTLVPIGSTQWQNFTYTSASGIALEAVLVKASGTTLKAQDFSASATLVVDYQ